MLKGGTTKSSASRPEGLRTLYPGSGKAPLEGLYLSNDLRRCIAAEGVYVYSNFIASLDGRIAIAPSGTGELRSRRTRPIPGTGGCY